MALGYAYLQAHSLLTGPQLTLLEPASVIQHKRTITVRGETKNITELTLNGKVIHTDEGGMFNEQLVLPDGYTIMTLHAKDRFGRTTSLSRELVYQQDS
jgi:hypothetical protein